MIRNTALVLLLGFFVLNTITFAEEYEGIDPNRVKEIAAMLSDKPTGFGPPITDRKSWDKMAKSKYGKAVIARAAKWFKVPIYEMSDEIYLDFFESGSRKLWNNYRSQSLFRLKDLVVAECIENEGRFLRDIEETIKVICKARTWIMPPHDLEQHSFYGREKKIDLNVANVSTELATTYYWLADRLSDETKQLIKNTIRERTFDTFKDILAGEYHTWLIDYITNNWVAVCYSGIFGASQILIESKEERALFVAAMEHYISNYIGGFTDEGYCWEGVGYWDYGFSRFILLSEAMCQVTGGKIDLMENKKVEKMAKFALRMEILPRVYPSFADCRYNTKPSRYALNFISKRYGLGLEEWEVEDETEFVYGQNIYGVALYAFANSSTSAVKKCGNEFELGIREWFKEGGVLVGRPCEEQNEKAMAVAIKGGHNAESHNHNDLGNFILVVGNKIPITDAGGEVYTIRTFGPDRYVSKALNSYGHNVPIVAEQLQKEGKEAKAEIVDSEFTNRQDKLVFDISSAYDVKELEKLERTFCYSREGECSLTIIDEVCFSKPESFGTALITYGQVKWSGNGNLVISDGEESVKVRIAVTGGEFEIVLDTIEEDMNNGGIGYPKRIGINLKEPVKEAMIKMEIFPFSKE